jgi:hypothetical protein
MFHVSPLPAIAAAIPTHQNQPKRDASAFGEVNSITPMTNPQLCNWISSICRRCSLRILDVAPRFSAPGFRGLSQRNIADALCVYEALL